MIDPKIDAWFRSIDKATFQAASCQGEEPSEAAVRSFERTIGFRLPHDFRVFTRSGLGGLALQVREELWPAPKLYEVGPFWSFLRGLKVFGIAKGIPEWLDIREEYANFGGRPLVPFFALIGSADRSCFDRNGRIWNWSHEEPDNPRRAEDTSFSKLLLREIHELEERKDRKLAELKPAAPKKRAASAKRTSKVKKGAKPSR